MDRPILIDRKEVARAHPLHAIIRFVSTCNSPKNQEEERNTSRQVILKIKMKRTVFYYNRGPKSLVEHLTGAPDGVIPHICQNDSSHVMIL